MYTFWDNLFEVYVNFFIWYIVRVFEGVFGLETVVNLKVYFTECVFKFLVL